MDNSAVVILAAGIGSRMKEITSKTSKCIVDLDGITPLEHTILSFAECGVTKVIIVVGHYHDKVMKSVMSKAGKRFSSEIIFVYNDKYNYHGCEYSLACASELFNDYDKIYVTEGDLLLDKSYVKKIVKDDSDCAILLRDPKYIDKTRSVVAIDNQGTGGVDQFIYDPKHINVFDHFDKSVRVRGESIQLWKFKGLPLRLLTDKLIDYYSMANDSEVPIDHSGLYSINKIITDYPMTPIMIKGENWINLNTVEDIEIAKSVNWLNR